MRKATTKAKMTVKVESMLSPAKKGTSLINYHFSDFLSKTYIVHLGGDTRNKTKTLVHRGRGEIREVSKTQKDSRRGGG
jgi:hypothetical protein